MHHMSVKLWVKSYYSRRVIITFNVHFCAFFSFVLHTYSSQMMKLLIRVLSPVVFMCSIHPKCKGRIIVWLYVAEDFETTSTQMFFVSFYVFIQSLLFLFVFLFFFFFYNCGPYKSFQLPRFLSITHCALSRLWSHRCLLSRLSELFEDTNRKQHHSQHHNLNCWLPPQSTGQMILHIYQFCC